MVDIYLLENNTIRIKGKSQKIYINAKNPPPVAGGVKKEDEGAIFLLGSNQMAWDFDPKFGFAIFGPGEYEYQGVEFLGLRGKNGETLYQIKIDGVYIFYLGEFGGRLTQNQIEELSQVDVLISEVGGEGQNPKGFLETAQTLDSKILIPLPKTDQSLRAIFNELGKPVPAETPKVSVSREKLPEELEVVLLAESD